MQGLLSQRRQLNWALRCTCARIMWSTPYEPPGARCNVLLANLQIGSHELCTIPRMNSVCPE